MFSSHLQAVRMHCRKIIIEPPILNDESRWTYVDNINTNRSAHAAMTLMNKKGGFQQTTGGVIIKKLDKPESFHDVYFIEVCSWFQIKEIGTDEGMEEGKTV